MSEEGKVPAAEPDSLCEGITASWALPAGAENHLARGRLLSVGLLKASLVNQVEGFIMYEHQTKQKPERRFRGKKWVSKTVENIDTLEDLIFFFFFKLYKLCFACREH